MTHLPTVPHRNHRVLGLLLILAALLWLPAGAAHAGTSCLYKNSPAPLDFGNVSVNGAGGASSTVQINYTCTSYDAAQTFTLCASGPISDNIGSYTRPVMIGPGNSPKLLYNYYTDPGRTIGWSTTQFVTAPVTMGGSPPNSGTPVVVSGALTIYAAIPGNQTTVVAGSYAGTVYGINLGFLDGSQCPQTLGQLSGNTGAAISARAMVSNACSVSVSATNIDFGSQPATATNLSSSNTITVDCLPGTAYTVGLTPSNGSNIGSGVMKRTGTDTVPYQLHSVSENGPNWGNSAGYLVSGTSTGKLSAYATVGSANHTPGTYSDTVTISVNY